MPYSIIKNNAVYHGGDQMWTFMKQIFGSFSKLRHDLFHLVESVEPDGSTFLSAQIRRNMWMLGNGKNESADVCAPFALLGKLGIGDHPDAFNGLQFKEVWIYWDTALLAPFMSKDAVVFRTDNPFVDSS
ncbi:hypothetical protein F5884DRAFT_111021 [Xylogone sp. PMI_703]|nr:hypothetical protein F5884DRAFT_111021 [Xylogone sp. PMI_703]